METTGSKLFAAAVSLGVTSLIVYLGGVESRAPADTARDAQTRAVFEATTAFLKSLNEDQRSSGCFNSAGTISLSTSRSRENVAPWPRR